MIGGGPTRLSSGSESRPGIRVLSRRVSSHTARPDTTQPPARPGESADRGLSARGRGLTDRPGGWGFAAHVTVRVPLDARDVDAVLDFERYPADPALPSDPVAVLRAHYARGAAARPRPSKQG